VKLERPMVSFSFDDAPATACEAGARVLEARGLRGTYYFAAGLTGTRRADGPFRHRGGRRPPARRRPRDRLPHLLAPGLRPGLANETLADIDLNARHLAEWGAGEPVSFAYPYGDVAAPAKTALAGRFKTLRALHHGLIANGADLNQAPAVGIEGADGEQVALDWLDKAHRRKAWLILYTHDVSRPALAVGLHDRGPGAAGRRRADGGLRRGDRGRRRAADRAVARVAGSCDRHVRLAGSGKQMKPPIKRLYAPPMRAPRPRWPAGRPPRC
jgi:peptidoglycan/xylan/chitin deacetylase (PgdA/CDA1 family)